MSPLPLRRYRAERLLAEQFERLRASVIAGVAARLRAVGVRLDDGDLEASYSQAWQGLYTAVLGGDEIANPEAWLALVTYRRALDEHRARGRVKRGPVDSTGDRNNAALAGGTRPGRDIADELDDRVRLRQLFEGLRGRLSTREQQAATLCYLQGLSRAEAAKRMGVSETRMHKLMDGRGGHAPGVARKVGALVETIGAGRWCDEQGSLMRGFAYGILDPAGERYRLAELHHAECPACRAYVLSLRGLAAVLPPIPALLAPLLGVGAAGAAAASGSAGAAGSATSAGGAQLGASALSASGAAGAGAAGATGGGWWLAGSLGAKLAAGCLVALGVGAGCVALGGRAQDGGTGEHRHAHSSTVSRTAARERASAAVASKIGDETSARQLGTDAQTQAAAAPLAPSAQAAREFGPEQAAGAGDDDSDRGAGTGRAAARAATARPTSAGGEPEATSARASAGTGIGTDSERAAPDGASAAEREFAPG